MKKNVMCCVLSRVQLFGTPWIVASQDLLSIEFSKQAYWSGLQFPSLRDLPDPGIESGSPAVQADSLPSELPGKPTPSSSLSQTQLARVLLLGFSHIVPFFGCPIFTSLKSIL